MTPGFLRLAVFLFAQILFLVALRSDPQSVGRGLVGARSSYVMSRRTWKLLTLALGVAAFSATIDLLRHWF